MLTTKKLLEIQPGQTVIVRSIDSGCCLHKRLSELGVVPGAAIKVLQNIGCGPVLIEVKGAKTALGRGASDAILVREITSTI